MATKIEREKPTEEDRARSRRSRLLGARYEIEESLKSVRDERKPDGILDQHLKGALLDVEGAIQRVEKLLDRHAATG